MKQNIFLMVMALSAFVIAPSLAFAFQIVGQGSYVEGNTLYITQPQWIKGDDGAWHNFTDYVGMYQEGANIVIEYGRKTVIVTPYIETPTLEPVKVGDVKVNDMTFSYETEKTAASHEFALNVNNVVEKDSAVSFDVWSDKTEVVNDGLKYYFDGMTLDFSDIKDMGFNTKSLDGNIKVDLLVGNNNLDPTLTLNGTQTICGNYTIYDNVLIENATLIGCNDSILYFNALTFTMHNATINLTGKGNSSIAWGAGSSSANSGGGGSYGGIGGNGTGSPYGAGGSVYGTISGSDIQLGSPGGVVTGQPRGWGGGAILVTATNITINNKGIYADGVNGSIGGANGGGSGGGIFLNASGALDITNATLSAMGSNGTSTAYLGGAGGGGRIKLRYAALISNGSSINASGAQQPVAATEGTVLYNTIYTFNFFDEDSLIPVKNVSLMIFNQTYVYNLSELENTTKINYPNMPNGAVTIMATYAGIIKYSYTTINTIETSVTYNFYFATTSLPFTFFSNYNTAPIANAKINITRYINGSWTLVGQALTEITGYAIAYIKPNTPYQYTAEAANYATIYANSSFPSTLVSSPINLNFGISNSSYYSPPTNQFLLPNVNITWKPNILIIMQPTAVNVTFNDSNSQTAWISLNVSKYLNTTGVGVYFDNTTASYKTNSYTISSTGQYKFRLCYFYGNTTTNCFERWYTYTGSYSGIGNMTVQDIDNAGGFSVTFFRIIFFFLMCFVCAVLWPFIGVGTLFILILCMILGAFFGIFTIGETILMVLLSVIMIRVAWK